MSISIRKAGPDDRDSFLRLILDKKTYPPYLIRDLSSDSQKIAHVSSYRAHWELDWEAHRFQILLAERGRSLKGYAVLRGDLIDSVTRQAQTCVYDFWAQTPALARDLLEEARASAVQLGTKHLVIEVSPDQADERVLVESLGYLPEIHRVARRAQAWTAPDGAVFALRRARQTDSLFVIHLNAVSLPVVIPPGRPLDMDRISMDFMTHYATLDLESDPELLVLILEKGRRQAGYLILKRGVPSTNLAYVYDIAVDRRYQGQGAAQHLVNGGSDAVFQEGFTALTGDISATNPRALKTAIQGLGFEVERHRYGRPVD